MKNIYPTWRYHKDLDAKIIHSEKEEQKDWKDSPAHFQDAIIEDLKLEDLKLEDVKKPSKKK